MDLERLKEHCEYQNWIHSDVVVKLIETIEEQQKELDSWRKEFMGV